MKRASILALLLATVAVPAVAVEKPREAFVFEGEVTEVDPRLAPVVEVDHVLSGQFMLFEGGTAAVLHAGDYKTVYGSFLEDAHFLLDKNFVVTYSGRHDQRPETAEVVNDLATAEFKDLYTVSIPVSAPAIGAEKYEAKWFEMWFYDPEGEMFSSPSLPRKEFPFKSAWFRLSFYSPDESEVLTAEGPVTYLELQAAEMTPEEEISVLESYVVELSARLEEAETELAKAEDMILGLNEELRREEQEKAALVEELAALKSEAIAPAEVDELRAGFEQEKAQLAQEVSALEDELTAVVDQLSAAYEENQRMKAEYLANLLELEEALELKRAEEVQAAEVAVEPEQTPEEPVVAAPVPEQPAPSAKPASVPPMPASVPTKPVAEAEVEAQEEREPSASRPLRPRKFR